MGGDRARTICRREPELTQTFQIPPNGRYLLEVVELGQEQLQNHVIVTSLDNQQGAQYERPHLHKI